MNKEQELIALIKKRNSLFLQIYLLEDSIEGLNKCVSLLEEQIEKYYTNIDDLTNEILELEVEI